MLGTIAVDEAAEGTLVVMAVEVRFGMNSPHGKRYISRI
jgi:hypothetical protein